MGWWIVLTAVMVGGVVAREGLLWGLYAAGCGAVFLGGGWLYCRWRGLKP